jgi:hypothetical protein
MVCNVECICHDDCWPKILNESCDEEKKVSMSQMWREMRCHSGHHLLLRDLGEPDPKQGGKL